MSKLSDDTITLYVDEETERILGELQQAVQGGMEDVLKQAKLAKQLKIDELEETLLYTLKTTDQAIDKKMEKIKMLLQETTAQLKTLMLQMAEENLQASKQLKLKAEDDQAHLLNELEDLKTAIKDSHQTHFQIMQEAAVSVQGHFSGMDEQMISLQIGLEERLDRMSNRIEQQQEEWRAYLEEQALIQSVPGYVSLFFGKQKALEKARKKQSQ
ncbi:hypothetical protein [Brevibacillus sp. 179-C9.3 HS]|uniref:hypothetical protein n=1 Tax=unclassified Brevibacillus TaxID=2684853 RepID=UPI0039A0913C